MSALEPLAEATKARMRAQYEWEQAMREARKSHSLRVVASAAGVSHARVAQITGSSVVERIEAYSA